MITKRHHTARPPACEWPWDGNVRPAQIREWCCEGLQAEYQAMCSSSPDIEPNRRSLEANIDYSFRSGVIDRHFPVDELFRNAQQKPANPSTG